MNPKTDPEPSAAYRATKAYGLLNRQIVFPAFAILVLLLIWAAAWTVVRIERNVAQQAAQDSAAELARTYEARVLRAMREIEQHLNLIKYAYEVNGGSKSIDELRMRSLWPSELLFKVTIVDGGGKVIAGDHAALGLQLLGPRDLEELQRTGELPLGVAGSVPLRGQTLMRIARALHVEDGAFAAVVLQVDAAYFVSDYDPRKLGKSGLIGLLAADGSYLVKRTGDDVSTGGRLPPSANALAPTAGREINELGDIAPDHVRRFTAIRRLYGFPLMTAVGLAEEEQLASVRQEIRRNLLFAAAASAAVLALVGLLWRLSWQLTTLRAQEERARAAYAERIEFQAYHDSLTGLPNRTLYGKLQQQGLSEARRYNHRLAVLFLDLDDFKNINDDFGHDTGDLVLVEMARRLTSCTRSSDVVARLGGDEFVVLLPRIDDALSVDKVASAIAAAVARPFELAGHIHGVTVSIGIATFPEDGTDEQTLRIKADSAMYMAKQRGKNNFQFHPGSSDPARVPTTPN